MYYKILSLLIIFSIHCVAGTIKVSTLNTMWCFNSQSAIKSQVSAPKDMTAEQYQKKIYNLSGFINGNNIVAIQEIGGVSELNDLILSNHYNVAFTQGRDTYTGQNVGILYNIPDWTMVNSGRIPILNKILSKHLCVVFKNKTSPEILIILTYHLIRPIGNNKDKHHEQINALNQWASAIIKLPNTRIILLGDSNSTTKSNIFPELTDAAQQYGYPSTQLMNAPLDRINYSSKITLVNYTVSKPPYGNKPNAYNKTIWTDHSLVTAEFKLD